MRYYRTVIVPKPGTDTDSETQNPLLYNELRFGIGDDSDLGSPEDMIDYTMRELGIRGVMVATTNEIGPSRMAADPFTEWLRTQPFGGPSRIPGRSLLSETTLKMMRLAWDAAVNREAGLSLSPEDPWAAQEQALRRRGDIRD
jgi:hypothetical protein